MPTLDFSDSTENLNPATTLTVNNYGNLTINNYGSGDIIVNNYHGGPESQKAETSGTPPNSKWRNLRNLIVGFLTLVPLTPGVAELIKLFMLCLGICI